MLLENIFKDIKQNEQILITHKTDDKNWPRLLVDTLEDAAKYAEQHRERDCYFGVAPRLRGELEQVSRITCLWADFDSKEFGSIEDTKVAISRFSAPPSFVVFSGHGYHTYHLLKSSVEPSRATSIMKSMCHLTGSDAVHDAGRRLRIPGTTNTKRKPYQTVRIEEAHTELIYSANDLEALCKVSKKITSVMYTAQLSQGKDWNYHSRSERDLSVITELVRNKVSDSCIEMLCLAMPFGERIQEDGGLRLLQQYDIPKAKSLAERTLSKNFQESNDHCYWFTTETKRKKVSTFTVKPTKLLRSLDGDADTIVGDVQSMGQEFKDQTFSREVFNSTISFLKDTKHAEIQWLGSDHEIRQLLPALLQHIKEEDLPTAYGTKILGRHKGHWVSNGLTFNSEKSFNPDGAPYVYIPSGREAPRVKYLFPPEEEYRVLVQQIFKLLPRINQPEVIIPIIGWFFAAPLAQVFRDAGINFPHLNLFGTTGSGKTTTIESVFLPLSGYYQPTAYSYHMTRFSLLALMSSTNSIPVSFSEYRVSFRSQRHDDFLDILRNAFNQHEDVRGRADQTTMSYPLIAPVCVDGEDALEDPTNAIKERTIIVNLHPVTVKEDTSYFKALKDLIELPLSTFAGPYIRYTLSVGGKKIKRLFKKSMVELKEAMPLIIPDRPRRNLAVILTGMKLYNEFAAFHGARGISWSSSMFEPILDNILLRVGSGETKVGVDGFIEDLVNCISIENGRPQFLYQYDADTTALWFNPMTVWMWWKTARLRQGRDSMGYRAVLTQLEERTPQYTVAGGFHERNFEGRRFRCFGVELARCYKAGLDVPDSLQFQGEFGNIEEDGLG